MYHLTALVGETAHNMVKHSAIIDGVKTLLKKRFLNESTGHDWWHIVRVYIYNNACHLSNQISQPHDRFIVELGVLLHDVADWKFHNGDKNEGPKQAAIILN